MAEKQQLLLKVLWIFNCNEAEIALDFQFEEDGTNYQVKGSGPGAFNGNKELRVCQADNLENIIFVKPETPVIIQEEDKISHIKNYWKKGSGESRYNTILTHLDKLRESHNEVLYNESQTNKGLLKGQQVELSKKQIFDLVFEIEAIIGMLRAIKGSVTKKQVEDLIKNATEGFAEKSVLEVKEELKRKNLI